MPSLARFASILAVSGLSSATMVMSADSPASFVSPDFASPEYASPDILGQPSSLAQLTVKLVPGADDPLVLEVHVTNNRHVPVTFLAYDSPLDSAALDLGLVSVTLKNESQPLALAVKQVRRPAPGQYDYFTVGAGETVQGELDLEKRDGPGKKIRAAGGATVAMKGVWKAVWAGDNVSVEGLVEGGTEKYGTGSSGPFEAEAVEVSV